MPQPRYLQIVQQLRDRIQNGEYPPNTRIPTENELSVSMGVSRPTVRQALNLLEQEDEVVYKPCHKSVSEFGIWK